MTDLSRAVVVAVVGLMLSGCGSGGQALPPTPAPDAVVQGYVRDAATDDGVAGVSVTVRARSATTDATGRYRVTGVATGQCTVNVVPPGGYVLAGAVPPQQVSAGTNTLPDIYLVAGAQGPPDAPPI